MTIRLLIKHKIRQLLAVRRKAQIIKQIFAKAGALDGLQILLRNNLVRIHIRHGQGRGNAFEGSEWLH